MKRVALVLACIVLVMASVGTVAADGGYVVHLPLVTALASAVTPGAQIESLMAADASVYILVFDGVSEWPVARFALDCDDWTSLAAPDNWLRHPETSLGSPDGPYSAMNPGAELPPYVYDGNGQRIWITENPSLSPRLDTTETLAYIDARSGCRR